jgi:hypothetical protein
MGKRVDGIRANTTDAVLALQCGRKKMPVFSRSVVGLSGSGPNTARVNMLDIQVSPLGCCVCLDPQTHACCKLDRIVSHEAGE